MRKEDVVCLGKPVANPRTAEIKECRTATAMQASAPENEKQTNNTRTMFKKRNARANPQNNKWREKQSTACPLAYPLLWSILLATVGGAGRILRILEL